MDNCDAKTKEDKLSRIIDIENYLTSKIISNRGGKYQPNNQDGDQCLRDEVDKLRIELGILRGVKLNKSNPDNL
jgi:hypothetical protein